MAIPVLTTSDASVAANRILRSPDAAIAVRFDSPAVPVVEGDEDAEQADQDGGADQADQQDNQADQQDNQADQQDNQADQQDNQQADQQAAQGDAAAVDVGQEAADYFQANDEVDRMAEDAQFRRGIVVGVLLLLAVGVLVAQALLGVPSEEIDRALREQLRDNDRVSGSAAGLRALRTQVLKRITAARQS
jgi:hypothetical protein